MLNNGLSRYRRLQEAFCRVFASTIFFGTKDEMQEAEVWDCGRGHFLDHMHLWFRNDGATNRRTENIVTLSPAFWEELQAHPTRLTPRSCGHWRTIRAVWIFTRGFTWRCYQARELQRILFGPAGLARVNSSFRSMRASGNSRERVRLWLDLVRLYWLGLPGEDREERSGSRTRQRNRCLSLAVRLKGELKCPYKRSPKVESGQFRSNRSRPRFTPVISGRGE